MDTPLLTVRLFKEMFSWRGALDILLMTGLLFFLYRTLLRLGTWKIVTGIFIAAAAFFAANLLNLTGITWIYSNLSHVAVIALIVIFQPELRKLFERAASVRRNEIGDVGNLLAEMVADALFVLAQQWRGAIVVFPGKEPVREWVTGGYDLNADPSYPLILSIFDPNSPGHDGALIIRNGRCTRFGVRLPMSTSTVLSENYGTRHHAAMGLAELTDALVLVVSEERGQVSIFEQGKVRSAPDKPSIVAALRAHWRKTASYSFGLPGGVKRWLLAPQMIVSLVLAVFLWSGLISAQGEILEKVLPVPVEYTATPEWLALVGERSTEVKLHLAGSKPDLDALNPADLSVKIDLSKAMPGTQTVAINEETIRLPRRIKLLDAVPPTLELTLAAIVEQEVTVKPQLVGQLPAGLKLRYVKVLPQQVRVRSPSKEAMLPNLNLTTTPIYLETIREDTRIFCKIIAPPTVQPAGKPWPDVEVQIAVSSGQP